VPYNANFAGKKRLLYGWDTEQYSATAEGSCAVDVSGSTSLKTKTKIRTLKKKKKKLTG
jgi:hypothetical protein